MIRKGGQVDPDLDGLGGHQYRGPAGRRPAGTEPGEQPLLQSRSVQRAGPADQQLAVRLDLGGPAGEPTGEQGVHRAGPVDAAASNASTTPGPGRPSHTIRAVGTAGADPTRTRSPLVRAG